MRGNAARRLTLACIPIALVAVLAAPGGIADPIYIGNIGAGTYEGAAADWTWWVDGTDTVLDGGWPDAPHVNALVTCESQGPGTAPVCSGTIDVTGAFGRAFCYFDDRGNAIGIIHFAGVVPEECTEAYVYFSDGTGVCGLWIDLIGESHLVGTGTALVTGTC